MLIVLVLSTAAARFSGIKNHEKGQVQRKKQRIDYLDAVVPESLARA
jgi:hypothetical protein